MPITAGSQIVASDFVSTSSGSGDSGKVFKLNSNGDIPTSFKRAIFDTTQVFSGTAVGTTFVDLDLSSVVGAKQRVVLLRCQNTSTSGGGSTSAFYFKKKGESGTLPTSDIGVSSVSITSSPATGTTTDIGYVIVPTDSNGKVQWATSRNDQNVVVNVEAYW